MIKQGGKIILIFSLIFFCFSPIIFFTQAQTLVNINTASLEELDTLPGIGPSKAQAIIDYRNNNGFFVVIEDIMKVSGIGQVTFDNIKNSITVGETTPLLEQPPESAPTPGSTEQAEVSPSPAPVVLEENHSFKLGDVVINEFVSDPADGEEEWIEVYNNTGRAISLDGWTIEEGSGAKTILSGTIDSSATPGINNFFVILSPKGNLNNAGDIMILRDDSGNLIDQVSYGNWDDGEKADNAPVAGDPAGTARKFDGQNSYNNLNDFSVSFSPTKGEVNIILAQEAGADSSLSAYSNDIVVSEIFPNPEGDDSLAEFIELYNRGSQDADLTGWKIGDESQNRFTFKSGGANIIKAGEYIALYRERTNISLNNNGDSVKLFHPGESESYLTVKYENVIESWSYNLNNQEWIWSEIITPGKANEIKTINNPPVVDFSCPATVGAGTPVDFSADDTFDADGDALQYFWDFGDGVKNNLKNPQHTFLQAGDFNVSLTVKDKEVEINKEKIITVSGDRGSSSSTDKYGILINEFLPNPDGSDTEGEWIELYNQGGEVNLLNWKIDDSDGGSKPYEVSSDLWFDPGDFFLLPRPESGLALNNTSDSIRLFNDQSELMDEIEYESAVEGESYARGENGKWFWTTALTPKEKNIISLSDSKNYSMVLGEKIGGNMSIVSLAEAQEMEGGEAAHVFGAVAVLPGALGSQYFYIVDDSGGMQIYNYKKEFPALRVGDYLEVYGEIAVSNGEKRIKTKISEDMIFLDHRDEPTAVETTCDKIDDSYVGRLIKISGEITERKSSVVYFDDGTDEAIVYIKKSTGISLSELKEGESFSIVGMVGKTKSGIRIMPRKPDDIIKTVGAGEDGGGQVLGEVAVSDEWAIAKRDKKLELFKYLLVIAGGVIILLSIGLTRINSRNKL